MGLIAVGLMAIPVVARAAAPSVHLRRSSSHLTLRSFGSRTELDLGVFAVSDGGSFQLDVSRRNYEAPERVRQVDAATGQVLRTLPSSTLDGWDGLADFVQIDFRHGHRLVASQSFDFCPNGADRERVNDAGPVLPTYPSVCSTARFPFTKGMVWGIDRGWAVGALGTGNPDFVSEGFLRSRPPTMRVPPGRYSVRVSVAKRYRRLLDVPVKRASVRLRVNVKQRRRCCRGTPIPPDRVSGTESSGPEPNVPTVAAPDPSTLPDLEALPAWGISTDSLDRRDQLQFAAVEWNAGPGSLAVEGFRRSTKRLMDAYQYFYDAAGNVVGRSRVGILHYDSRKGHEHWHFQEFARYSLLDSKGNKVVRSHKQSFCIAPTNPVDLTVAGASWQPELTGLRSACGALDAIWIRESLDPGWGDTYFQWRAGQSIDITHVPNGSYRLQVQVNPGHRLHEVSTANDTQVRRIHIGGSRGHRTVTARPWHGITD